MIFLKFIKLPKLNLLGCICSALFFSLFNVPRTFSHPDTLVRIAEISSGMVKDGESVSLLTQRGNLFLEHSEFDKAENDFNSALKLNPDFWEAVYGKAQVFSSNRKLQEALNLLKTLDQCPIKSNCRTSSLYLRAQLFSQIKDNKQALENLNELVKELEDPDPSLYLWRADLCEQSGDAKLSLTGLLEGLERHPNVPSLVDKVIVLQEGLGQIEQAVVLLDQVIEAAPRKDQLLLRKSELLLRHGKIKESRVAAQRGLEELKLLPKPVQERAAIVEERDKLLALSKFII